MPPPLGVRCACFCVCGCVLVRVIEITGGGVRLRLRASLRASPSGFACEPTRSHDPTRTQRAVCTGGARGCSVGSCGKPRHIAAVFTTTKHCRAAFWCASFWVFGAPPHASPPSSICGFYIPPTTRSMMVGTFSWCWRALANSNSATVWAGLRLISFTLICGF